MAIPRQGRHPVRAQEAQARRDVGIAADDHAALADREILVREEAVRTGPSERADVASVQPRSERVRGILEQQEPVLLRERGERLGLAGMTAVGHAHDRLRARRDAGAHRGGIQPRLGQADDVGEHRGGARVRDRIRGGDERQRGHDDLVAGAEPCGHRHQVQGRRAVGHGHGVACPGVLGERLLELLRTRPLAEPARPVHVGHGCDVRLGHDDVGERHAPARDGDGGHQAQLTGRRSPRAARKG